MKNMSHMPYMSIVICVSHKGIYMPQTFCAFLMPGLQGGKPLARHGQLADVVRSIKDRCAADLSRTSKGGAWSWDFGCFAVAQPTLVAERGSVAFGPLWALPWWTSSTPWPCSMATSPTAASSHVGDTVRDNYIPLFSDKPQDYKEWRKRIKLYQKKMELQKKNKEATINLLTSLSGISWRQVEHMVDKGVRGRDWIRPGVGSVGQVLQV